MNVLIYDAPYLHSSVFSISSSTCSSSSFDSTSSMRHVQSAVFIRKCAWRVFSSDFPDNDLSTGKPRKTTCMLFNPRRCHEIANYGGEVHRLVKAPSRGLTGRLLSKIIRVALLHNGRSKVIIMGRSVDNFRHSIMVVYMVLKLSSVGGHS